MLQAASSPHYSGNEKTPIIRLVLIPGFIECMSRRGNDSAARFFGDANDSVRLRKPGLKTSGPKIDFICPSAACVLTAARRFYIEFAPAAARPRCRPVFRSMALHRNHSIVRTAPFRANIAYPTGFGNRRYSARPLHTSRRTILEIRCGPTARISIFIPIFVSKRSL